MEFSRVGWGRDHRRRAPRGRTVPMGWGPEGRTLPQSCTGCRTSSGEPGVAPHAPDGSGAVLRPGPLGPRRRVASGSRVLGRTPGRSTRSPSASSRKEVIQPHLPVRLPCYDFVPIADPTFDGSLLAVGPPASGVTDFHDVTGGVYKARERIHRSVADLRLLATPASCSRVADCNPN